MRKTLLTAVATVALTLTVAACQPNSPEQPTAENTEIAEPAPEATQGDIITVATEAGSFNTLAQLLTEAELVSALQGPGPFTVFAPTDAAFGAVDAATLGGLKADKAALTRVLQHHVVSGETMSAAIADGSTEVTTLAGTTLTIEKTAEGVKVGGANVTQPDVDASNGVIHVIDAVLIPAA